MGRFRRPYTLVKRGKIYYYRTYDPDGYRTTAKSTGCTTKTAAMEYCEALHLSGNLYKSKQTFRQYAEHFYDEGSTFLKDRQKPLKHGTVYHYQTILNSKLLPAFGDMELSEITVTMLKNYRIRLMDEGLNVSSINLVFTTLRNIFQAAFFDDVISSNPLDKIKRFSTEGGTRRTAYTLDELSQMIREFPQYRNIIILLACTGMRISEALGVTDKDVVIEDGAEYIDLKQQWNFTFKRYESCKDDSMRHIPVISELKLRFSPYTDYQTFARNIKAFNEKHGIKNKTLHSIRHFFISDTKSKNVNPLKVEYVAGHKFKGIEKIYTHMDYHQMSEILEWQQKIYDILIRV